MNIFTAKDDVVTLFIYDFAKKLFGLNDVVLVAGAKYDERLDNERLDDDE